MTTTEPAFLDFDELYSKVGVLGLEFSPRLAELAGQRVRMQGYLAPAHHGEPGPLVLTRAPFAGCSDCGSGHDWPDDSVFVFPTAAQPEFAPGKLTEVEGVLEYGSLRLADPDVLSLVRLRDAAWQDR
ncbi:hypothetical protein [Paracoccus siganidrum]|uniref:DUF3299 domain-containing protein n=1 Tax=Paracoccus siganidrum TaxID=1276757 RepID=A0A418ZUU1_9RHOB|nr:hypothetical protein [Paracoccus siganidrum]RJL02299.1 hypothetical protein D3P05_21900 [Paracoccus siganidrum]RMC24727.1 hypothetical protein C9E82_23310 [Paracoccus siganidrum]